ARGAIMPFAIALEDGEAMLRGEAEVVEAHSDGNGPQRRPGMRLRILSLDPSSREVHAELLARKRVGTPPPIPSDAPTRRSQEVRVPGSSYIVPANPFGALKAEALEYFIDCTLYEEEMPQPEPVATETTEPVSPLPYAKPGQPQARPSIVVEPVAAAPPKRRGWAAAVMTVVGAALGLGGGYMTWGTVPEQV